MGIDDIISKAADNRELKGDVLQIEDLFYFSNISLKRKRMRKKFCAQYARYITEEVRAIYNTQSFYQLIGASYK